MSSSQQKTLDDFLELQNRNALSHVIRAIVDLGIVKALRERQRTSDELAETLELNPLVVRHLMSVAEHSELIERYGDDFALSPIARLIPDRFLDFGNEYWQHLAFYAKTGAPLPICDELPTTDFDFIVNKATEEWTLAPVALSVSQVLDMANTRPGARILEIACGSAVFGIALAHSDPTSRLVLLDNEFGLEQASKTIESVELGDRVTVVSNEEPTALENLAELNDQSFDLVVIAGVIHRLSGGECQRLFQRVHSLVEDNREIAIVDVFPGQEKGNLSRSIFELELGMRTSRGRLHNPVKIESTLRESGFDRVQFAHLPATPHYWGLVLGQRD